MPWIVPSAEDLYFLGELGTDYLADEYDALWDKCNLMGSTQPKPDYTAGLSCNAFSEEEMHKLENYARPSHPFRVTANLLFPFLVCEVESDNMGLNRADRQNIHSASIAVRAIIMLYREAFNQVAPNRVSDLFGTILTFTITHDNDRVLIYGHYAVAASDRPDTLKFYRYPIALFSLSIRDCKDSNKPYNFVYNVYERFAPQHLKRIKDAVAGLASPPPADRVILNWIRS